MNKEIPIFFAVDNNYLPFLATTLVSIKENHKTEEILKVKILYTDINESNKERIKKYEDDKLKIDFIDVTCYVKEFQDKLFTRDYYSKTTYYRLFIPSLYKEYDKALYLDCDLIILDDISKLYNTDIEGYLLAAVPDEIIAKEEIFREYVEKVIGVKSYKNYFNAGVLLMNLKEMRNINFQDKFLYLLGTTKYRAIQDQDYLNRICKGRVKLIDVAWDKMPTGKEEDVFLVHFNLHLKPWHFDNIPYAHYFWDYAQKSGYYEDILKIKNNYTDKERELDEKSYLNVLEIAKKEASCVGDDRYE